MPKYLSGRSKVTPQSKLQSDRYRYLSIENAEPNLGDPLVGPSSITAKPVPPGQQFIIVSVEGSTSGERYWIPNQGGIIPGSISVFDENTLVGALSSITQLNFVGAAITASISIASSNLATIRVFSPGNNQEIIFNTANEFSTSTKLKFDPSNGLLTAGDRIIVGAGGTVITTTGIGSVGIGTTDPTQELHLQGDLRLTGTIYDFNNQPGTNAQILVKNNFGGLTWINQDAIRAGAGGTYQQVQFHNSSGLVGGALNFVFDDINSRIGIGSTQPKVLLDVLGISSFKGGTTIDNLIVTGITTTQNLQVTGVSTVGFVTGTSAFFTGIVTATKFVGELNVSNLYVTGISTLLQKVNIDSDLGVTGLTTTQNLQVYQSTTLNRLNAGLSTFTTVDINGGEIDVTRIGTQNLNVSGVGTFSSQVNINNLNVTGVGTFDNIKLESNTVSTTSGNLILDSLGGTTQINDAIFVNDSTQSNDKDQGSIVTQGGVGIEKNLNVGEQLSVVGVTTLASNGGITTTGGDLYVGGDLYIKDDIFYDEISGRRAEFTEFLKTKDFQVTGIATIKDLGVSGLTTTRNLKVIGISTFDNYIDANGGAYIDNIQIGISGDNEIDTTSGNLTIDSAGGTTTIDDQLIVSGISTFNNVTESTTTTNGSLIVSGGAGIAKNLNLGNNLTVSGTSTFNGNVTFGDDANTDTVSFTSKINSSVLPSTNSSSGIDGSGKDLGGASNYWRKVYANEFVGAITGNANTASQIAAITRSTNATHYLTFVDSDNSPAAYENLYTNSGVTYNPSTGSVGIGTTNPTSKLEINNNSIGDANSELRISGYGNIDFHNRLTAGAYNPITQADDKGIIFNNGSPETGNFVIAPWSASVGGIRITNSGNVLIGEGSPTGTASQPLQVTGGAYISGNLGIGNNNPGEKLQVDGNIRVGSSNTSNYIAFRGTLDDDQTPYTHTYIGERLYESGTEKSELLLFKGNDNFGDGFVGPDRIRLAAGEFRFDTYYGVAASGTFEQVATSANITNKMILTGTGNLGIGITNPTSKLHVSGTSLITGTTTFGSNVLPSGANQNIGSESQKWDYVYANNFSGPITGNVTGNANTASQIAAITRSTDATHYLTFVDSDNSPAAYENLYTNSGVTYNPSTGRFGIGTISPVSRFETQENTTSTTDLTITNSNTGNNITKASRIRFRLTDSVGTRKDVAYITAYTYNLDHSAGNYLSFSTRTADDTPTEKARLDNNGNFGIGTISPGCKLDVNGEIRAISDNAIVATGTNASDDVWGGSIEIREINQVGNTQTGSPYAPGLTFHWGNVAAAAIKMYGDGSLRFIAQGSTGSSYRPIYASDGNFSGNLSLGDASTDTISVNGSINTNVIPTGTRNLGSSGNRWDTVYANTFDGITKVTTTDLQTGNLLVTGIATVTGFFRPSVGSGSDKGIYWATDPGGGSGDEAFIRYYAESGENTRLHIGIRNDADDDIYLEATQTTVSSNLTVGGNTTLGDATSDTVTFTARVNSSVLPSTNGTLDLGGTSNRWSTIYATTFNGQFSGNATYADNAGIATNIKGGSQGSIPYQTASSTTALLAASGTNGSILTYDTDLKQPKWVVSSSFSGNATYADNAGIATNLKGLSTNIGQIPYQSAVSTTLFTTGGVNGVSLLRYNGTNAPTWVDPADLTAKNATFATNAGIATNIKGLSTNRGQIPYQSAVDTTLFTTGGTSGSSLLQYNGTGAPTWVSPANITGIRFVDYATNAGIATNIKGLSTNRGQIPYQSAVDTTLFTTGGTSGSSLLQYNGTGAPTWVSPANITGIRFVDYADNAGIATNIKGGSQGSIPYQTASSTTALLAASGTNGSILTYDTDLKQPKWVTPSNTTSNSSTNLTGGTAGDIPYQDGTGSTSYIDLGTSGQVLTVPTSGTTPQWKAIPVPTSISVISSANANLDHYITFVSSISGSLSILTDSDLKYNPSTNIITVQKINLTNILSGSTTIATFNGSGQQVTSFGVGTVPSGTAGEIRATNNITAYVTSDINLKTNIKPITEPIKKLSQINGVSFDWKDDYIAERGGEDGYFVRKHDIGVIAQEIEKVLPEIVVSRENGTKAIKYELLAPLLIEAIKEQQDMIINLQRRIEDLEK